MATPTAKELCEATGISLSYANKILLTGDHARKPPRPLAIAIYRATDWRHESIADLTEEQMATFEQVEPWFPPKEREAA